jgi:hypothetical protein
MLAVMRQWLRFELNLPPEDNNVVDIGGSGN